jgi:hypothetical protein
MGGWEGWIKEQKEWCSFHVSGTYVQDLRESRSSKKYKSPNAYRAENSTEGKRIAEDIYNGENLEKHEANRQAQIAEDKKSAKLISDAEKFIKKLQKQK